jgi:UDP-glucose 4-epimerase
MTAPGAVRRDGMARCLVTGASGFIGGQLVKRLLAATPGLSVECLVSPARLGAGHGEDLRRRGVAIIPGDLTTEGVADAPPPPVTVVFHLAANVDTAASAEAMRINDHGTAALLDWLQPVLARTHVVYVSSVAVMDRAGRADGPLTEASPCTPRTEYGASKLRGEQIIRDRAARDGFTYTIIRLPTIYGPGQKPGGLFDTLWSLAMRGHWLARLDWPGRTSVLHIDDVVRILTEFATRPDTRNETYCVTGPDAPTVGELARAIAAAGGRTLRPIRLPGWTWSALRAISLNQTLASLMPRALGVWFWRLSLLVDDGFWVDAAKFDAAAGPRPRALDEGLRQTFSGGGGGGGGASPPSASGSPIEPQSRLRAAERPDTGTHRFVTAR